MKEMKKILYIPAAAILIMLSTGCEKKSANNALIITDQNSSNRELSSKTLKNILDGSGLFTSTIKRGPAKGSDIIL
jgi:hypothetical protein